MQPLALCEIWACNSKALESYSIERDRAWHGGGQVGHVAPRGRGTSRHGTYGGVHASQCFYMISHLVELITVIGTAASVTYSPQQGRSDMWWHDTSMHHHAASTVVHHRGPREARSRSML